MSTTCRYMGPGLTDVARYIMQLIVILMSRLKRNPMTWRAISNRHYLLVFTGRTAKGPRGASDHERARELAAADVVLATYLQLQKEGPVRNC